MTERWRKRLGDLDKQSPSEDLFERAKGGPQLPDEPISRPSTSTRVVTGVAAFLVFALAISVFAIPALRLKGGSGPASFGPTMQPLWPWRSVDETKAWAADPGTIGETSATDFSSADATATAFGREVLGWGSDVYAHEQGGDQTFPCHDYYSQGPSDGSDLCSIYFDGGSQGPTVVPYAPTTSAPAFRTFFLSTCPPTAACDYPPPGPGSAIVVVYQPAGDGGPWAVLEAKSTNIRLSTTPGQTIVEGASLSASAQIPTGYDAALALHVEPSNGDPDCAFSITAGFTSAPAPGEQGISFLHGVDASIDAIYLQHAAERCGGDQLGYVFAVVTEDEAVVTGRAIDPLLASDQPVYEFAAVPVVVHIPPLTSESGTASESVSPVTEWSSYTDPLGWTIELPSSWLTGSASPPSGKVSYEGAWFSDGEVTAGASPGPANFPGDPVPTTGHVMVKIWHMDGGPVPSFDDDSSLPLSYDLIVKQQIGERLSGGRIPSRWP